MQALDGDADAELDTHLHALYILKCLDKMGYFEKSKGDDRFKIGAHLVRYGQFF